MPKRERGRTDRGWSGMGGVEGEEERGGGEREGERENRERRRHRATDR